MKGRIEYFDALRGTAMLMVVIGHIMLFSFHSDANTNPFFLIFNANIEIPLFFFVSGYFIYKPLSQINGRELLSSLLKKIIPFVISPSIFIIIYDFIYGIDIIASFNNDVMKSGYWFTFALIEFILIYYFIDFLIRKLTKGRFRKYIILFSGLIVSAIFGGHLVIYTGLIEYNGLFGIQHLSLYIYFILGIIYHSSSEYINSLLRRKTIILFCIVLFGLSVIVRCVVLNGNYELPFAISYYTMLLVNSLIKVCGLILIFILFRRNWGNWNAKVVKNFIVIIGKRTLDVYFLHYFFLPHNLHVIGFWFSANYNPLVEYLLATCLACIVICVSLGVGSLIRLSPYLGHYLFGAKLKSE